MFFSACRSKAKFTYGELPSQAKPTGFSPEMRTKMICACIHLIDKLNQILIGQVDAKKIYQIIAAPYGKSCCSH